MENEIICIDAGEWNYVAGYLICHGCGTPIHTTEMTGHHTHEVCCPFCGTFIGCDD